MKIVCHVILVNLCITLADKDIINSPRILLTAFVLLGVPLFLVFKEPDLSTSIMIVITFCVMLFVGGLSYKYIFGVLAVLIPAAVAHFAIILQPDADLSLLEGYQVTRILAWLEPEKYADSAAYQQLNSITAIGSGQLFGKGLDNNVIASVKNGNFISEPQTDFIFAIVGEELGFIGSATVVILILLIVWECFMIARNAKDLAGSLIASGVAGLIGLQAFLNIAVATGLAPNTGIPLPFVSYGGSSMLTNMAAIGIILGVSIRKTGLKF
jgi:rod shape determining protein RodA